MKLNQAPALALTTTPGAIFFSFLGFCWELVKSIFVIDEEIRRENKSLIRTLFFILFPPVFLIFGPSALFILLFYQAGFNLMLRASFGK